MLPHIGKIFLTGFSANIFRYTNIYINKYTVPSNKMTEVVRKYFLSVSPATIQYIYEGEATRLALLSLIFKPYKLL